MNRPPERRRTRGLTIAIAALVVGLAVALGASPIGTTANSPLAGTPVQLALGIAGVVVALLGAVFGIVLLRRVRSDDASERP